MAYGSGFVYCLDGSDVYTEASHYRSWGKYGKPELEWTIHIPFWNPEEGTDTHEEFLVRPDGYAHKAEMSIE